MASRISTFPDVSNFGTSAFPHRSILISEPVTGPIQIHIEHAFRLYLLHIYDTEGMHAPSPEITPPSTEQDSPSLNLSDISLEDHDRSFGTHSQSNKWISRRIEYGLADVILICFSLANRASFENVAEVVCVCSTGYIFSTLLSILS
jgi:hypothetical protein